MKVNFDEDIGGLWIIPETEFEEQWLKHNLNDKGNKAIKGMVRRGVDGTDYKLRIYGIEGFAQK